MLELARCEWIERRENVIALGPSGTGKTHVAQGLGLAACQRGLSVRFVTAAALVHELMEARDERRLLRLQKQFANHKLLIIDELGFVPLSKTGAELLFELVSQRYERTAVLITSNLPFLIHQAEIVCGHFRVTINDTLYTAFPLSHGDAACYTVLPALLSGSRATIGERFSASRHWDEIRRFGATVFDFIGATLTILWKRPTQSASSGRKPCGTRSAA